MDDDTTEKVIDLINTLINMPIMPITSVSTGTSNSDEGYDSNEELSDSNDSVSGNNFIESYGDNNISEADTQTTPSRSIIEDLIKNKKRTSTGDTILSPPVA